LRGVDRRILALRRLRSSVTGVRIRRRQLRIFVALHAAIELELVELRDRLTSSDSNKCWKQKQIEVSAAF
jgi:hypothetical protein